jgi:hypothetical protein
MSIPDRIVKLSKSYMGQVRERIDGALSERELALRELETGSGSAPISSSSSGSDPDSLMRRAEEKIAAARREMDASRELRPASAPVTASTPTPSATLDPDAAHYKILGVPPGSDYATVQAAFEKLTARLDANRFENETDKAEAGKILERVNSAYDSLRSKLDPTQNRFGKLEL